MNKPKHKIPTFKSEAQERAFWENRDSNDYGRLEQSPDRRFSTAKALHNDHPHPRHRRKAEYGEPRIVPGRQEK